MRQMKKEQGITLIALVITIIILLILAGISIATLTGENGILAKTERAKERTRQEEGREIIRLAIEEMRIERLEKGEELTLDYIGDHIHEKLKIEKEDVTKNGNPVEMVDVIYGDYEYRIDDNYQVEILGSIQGRLIISYTYEKIEKEGVIHLTVKTEDEKGIRKITKPDGEVVEYSNKEKEVTIDYIVTINGKYKFTAEGNNDSTRTKTVEVSGLDYFSITFDSSSDFLTIENSYNKSKETKTAEQNSAISEVTSLVVNSSLCGAIKITSNDSWTLLGRSNDLLIDNYYLYDRYGVNSSTKYVMGTWSAWSATKNAGVGANNKVSTTYSLNSSTGDFTVKAPNISYSFIDAKNGDIIYPYGGGTAGQNIGKTITRWKIVNRDVGTVQSSTMTSVAKVEKTRGALEREIISKGGIYQNNQVHSADNKWYIQKEQAKAYYLYKYIDKEIKTTYDVQNQIINTKKIDLTEEKESIRILINSDNMDYKLSISKDNENWIEIEDKAVLNGETNINLPEKWKSMYIKIERNNSVINQIEVK